jgi:hypothetical protein
MLNRLSGVAKVHRFRRVLQSMSPPARLDKTEAKGKSLSRFARLRISRYRRICGAYETIKSNNTTSLLMTGYILEAFRKNWRETGRLIKINRLNIHLMYINNT